MGRGSSKAGNTMEDYEGMHITRNSKGDIIKVTFDDPAKEWYNNKLTEKEKTAIYSMQNSTQTLNEYLSGRGTFSEEEKKEMKAEAEAVDSALSKFETKSEIVTYRGMNAQEFTNLYLGIDTVTKGVKSTSYDAKTAENFARNQGAFIVEYHIKPGHHGADLSGTPSDQEAEFMIRNGMKQKVIKKVGKNKLIVEIG